MPSIRVYPELRALAERVLRDSETLADFVETAIRSEISERDSQAAFICRGLASRAEAERTGEYFTIEETLQALDGIRAEHEHRRD